MDAYKTALEDAIRDREAQGRWYDRNRRVIDWPDMEAENQAALKALRDVRESAERRQAILDGRAEPRGWSDHRNHETPVNGCDECGERVAMQWQRATAFR